MTKTDWTPEREPAEEVDNLSATGMFLRALGSEIAQPPKQPEESLPKPAAVPEARPTSGLADQLFGSSQPPAPPKPLAAVPSQGEPGEFTRMFQASQPSRPPTQQVPAERPPVPFSEPRPVAAPVPVPPPASGSGSASAPGEFTRIFVKASDTLPPQPARSVPDLPPATPSDQPRMKGFSSPGVSDSASAEGSFTKFFQARPAAPVAAPTPHVQSFSPPMPAPTAPADEFKWPSESGFSSSPRPAADPTASSSSATGLFASLSSTPQRPAEVKPLPHEPVSSFPSAPPASSPVVEEGSVTRLIQRLSQQAPRTAPPVEAMQQPEEAADAPPPMASSEPGEFTRIISGSMLRSTINAPAAPAAAPPAAAPPIAAPPIAVSIASPPIPVVPAMPPPREKVAAAPAVRVQAPKVELPKVAAPKVALPAVAAPKTKLQELLPIILVVNTFLLIVLILVVVFALKAK